jgi:hypothetical protein
MGGHSDLADWMAGLVAGRRSKVNHPAAEPGAVAAVGTARPPVGASVTGAGGPPS